jgi:membrane-associated protease RseP (regulator of RpoE activity)
MDKTPVVQDIKQGSPASQAGLFPGDYLLDVGGKKVESVQHLKEILTAMGEGEVSITWQRDQQTFTAPLCWCKGQKIGASFTEGSGEVTETLGRRDVDSAKNIDLNPFPKQSRWVVVFACTAVCGFLACVILLFTHFWSVGGIALREESFLPILMLASFAAFNAFFACSLQIKYDTRWIAGEMLKNLKNGRKTD